MPQASDLFAEVVGKSPLQLSSLTHFPKAEDKTLSLQNVHLYSKGTMLNTYDNFTLNSNFALKAFGRNIELRVKLSYALQVINKGYFSEAFLFKPRGGRTPPSGLNRKTRKNPLFNLWYGAGANKHVLLTSDEIYIRSSLHPA